MDNNVECLGDRGKKKEETVLGTDCGLRFQGISNSSSSECNIYLGNYEKSVTMFFSQLLPWACSVPSAVSPLIANRGSLCHLAARCPHACPPHPPAPRGPRTPRIAGPTRAPAQGPQHCLEEEQEWHCC